MIGGENLRDFYEILEIERSSSQEEIKSSYRKLAKKYHPDLNPDDKEAQEHFKEINLAYEVLSDDNKRQIYDTYGEEGLKGNMGQGGFGGFSDIFGDLFDIFGGGFSSGYDTPYEDFRKRPVRGSDIRADITIEFKEAVFGTEREINIKRSETCEHCHGEGAEPGTEKKTCDKCKGTGKMKTVRQSAFGRFMQVEPCDKCKGTGEIIEDPCKECKGIGKKVVTKKINVKIPKGIDDKMVISLKGEGNAGDNGGEKGDLYVYVNVKEDKIFKRSGNNIYIELPITYSDAVLGGKIKVPTLTSIVDYDIPAGTSSGTTFKIKGEGVPFIKREAKGDLYFRVDIHVPRKISDEEREILEKLRLHEGKEITKERKTFFDKVKEIFE